jgi:hypothetical protein
MSSGGSEEYHLLFEWPFMALEVNFAFLLVVEENNFKIFAQNHFRPFHQNYVKEGKIPFGSTPCLANLMGWTNWFQTKGSVTLTSMMS